MVQLGPDLQAQALSPNLQQQQHTRPASVANINNAIQVGVFAARTAPHVVKIGSLVVQGELQDAQPLQQARHLQTEQSDSCPTDPVAQYLRP